MKRLLTMLSLLVLLLVMPVTVFADPVNGTKTLTEDDVIYTMNTYEDGTAMITNIVVAETVTEPIDLVIPASFTIDGEIYIVTDVNTITQRYEMIKSVSFEAEELPVILGNLFDFRKYVSASTVFPDDPIPSNIAPKEYPTIPGFISNNYNHDGNGDGTMDTYYAGANLVRVDPSYEGDFAVKDGTVSILAGAFWGCEKLEDVTIPDTVEWIGTTAFAYSSVTSVNIPLGLMNEGNRIEAWAFQNCEKLTTVTFPENAENKIAIGTYGFAGCSQLEGFDFSHISTIENNAFAYAFADGVEIDLEEANIGIYVPATFYSSGIGKVTLPSTVTDIPSWTFAECAHLSEVIIPDNIITIGTYAFENCTSLAADILAGTNVTTIKHRALANTAITELTIPEKVTQIDGGAFAGNEQLETINWKAGNLNPYLFLFSILNDCSTGVNYYPGQFMPAHSTDYWAEYTGLETLNIYALPSTASFFHGLEYLQTVNFLCDVTGLDDGYFRFCPSLETVTFSAPEKLTSIGSQVFQGCLNLKNFPFEELVNLTQIGNYAFFLTPHKDDNNSTGLVNAADYAALSDVRKGWGLTEIDLSNCTKLESIGNTAFYNQYNAQKIHLPKSLVNWISSVFQGTASLKELILEGDAPNRLFSSHFFSGTSGALVTFHDTLETVTIKGQLSAETSMFFSMPKLKTVNLPNATAIPVGAFMNCTALTSVTAPNVTSIGNEAFVSTGLTEVVIQADVTYGTHVFQNCAQLTTVVVEEGVTELPHFILEDTSALETLTLPETLENIGWGALKNSGLKQVHIPASVKLIHDDAFRGSAQAVILDGAPIILTECPDGTSSSIREPENNEYAIDETATIYYADEASKTAAEVYAQSLDLEDLGIEPYDTLVLEAEIDPEETLVGEALTGLTVTLNGDALTAGQYSVDYDPADETLGQRTVTVTLTDEALKKFSVDFGNITATGFDGVAVTGKTVKSITDADSICDTFSVTVVDHQEHIFDEPSDELAKAATCCAPAEYYAECSVEGCEVRSETITLPNGDPNADNHVDEAEWVSDAEKHIKVYDCCDTDVTDTEGKHEWKDGVCEVCEYACKHSDAAKDHKCDICKENVGKHEDTGKDHKCDYGCSEAIGTCEDKDNNGKCDYGCGKEFEVKPTEPEPTDPEPTEPKPTEPESTEPEDPKVEGVTRLAGKDRFETSLMAADMMKKNLGVDKFDTVILASGDNFADALTGSYLATVKKAPILLTYKAEQNAAVVNYVKENLKAGGTVYILGGTSAVDGSLDSMLAEFKVIRLDGKDRFDTNLLILKEAGIKAGDEILVCTSTDFADALSASAVAKPILLVHNEKSKLYDNQKDLLATLSGSKFCIIGGENAISADMEGLIKAYGATERLAGANRLVTSVMVAERYFPNAKDAVVAYGWNYPDGLCGGPLAFTMGAPVILAYSGYAEISAGFVAAKGISSGVVLGGEGLVSDATVDGIFAD